MARAKKSDGAKKRVKDLDPKGKAKNVKGGKTTVFTQVDRIGTRVGRRVEKIGVETGEDIQRRTAPR